MATFKIIGNNREELKVEDVVTYDCVVGTYDPLGCYDSGSDYYVLDALTEMKKKGTIKDFEMFGELTTIESEPDEIY